MSWWLQLDKKRGSQPRCVLTMDGGRFEVARRLNSLVCLTDFAVQEDDTWMPSGKPLQAKNGQWDKTPAMESKLVPKDGLLNDDQCEELISWWLDVKAGANMPNWDIASTCEIDSRKGLLLVEAKAHINELSAAGKLVPTKKNGLKNHQRIGTAIAEARVGLVEATNLEWQISRDTHYQLSNRFAWAWKLASIGIPVVLVYLGFLNAEEMRDRGPIFTSQDDWENSLRNHSESVCDTSVWGSRINIKGTLVVPLIRSVEQPFDPRIGA